LGAAPPSAEAATEPRTAESCASTPLRSQVKAVLTVFEGQAAFRLLPPGCDDFRAGDLFRVAHGSRTIDGNRS